MAALLDEETPTRYDAAPDGSAHQPVPADDDALVEEITVLAGHIAAATCRFLVLLGELDARGAWSGQGILGPAHWLSYRCGMGQVAAREHVRVARALRHLPGTVEAFGAGRLSYSKVRAITRVATPQTERDLVELAMSAPANHIERLVRGLRTAQDLDEVRDRHARRRLSWRWDEDGSLLLSGRFSPEDGARIVQTLEDLRDRAEDDLAGSVPGPEDERDLVDPFGSAGDEPSMAGRPRTEVHARRSLADALVELCTVIDVPDADVPRTSRPAETVVHVTLADLQSADDAPGTRPGAATSQEQPDPGTTAQPETVHAHTAAALAGQAPPMTTTPHLAGGPILHPAVARRLACDAGIVLQVHADGVAVTGRTLEVGARVRRPGAAVIRALLARDGGCRYPGCSRRRNLHAHHAVFWAMGGPTTLANLVLLCGEHHRLLHEGGYSLTLDLRGDGAVTIRDRRGRRVGPAPPMAGSTHGVLSAHPASGSSTIGPWTVGGRWGGEPLSLGYATSVLMTAWELGARTDRPDPSTPVGPSPHDSADCGNVADDEGTPQ